MQVLCMGEALIDMLATKEQNDSGTIESFRKFGPFFVPKRHKGCSEMGKPKLSRSILICSA